MGFPQASGAVSTYSISQQSHIVFFLNICDIHLHPPPNSYNYNLLLNIQNVDHLIILFSFDLALIQM